MSDDSIGLRIAEYISGKGSEKGFRAIEMGGNALNILNYLTEETEKIVIIDTAEMNGEPGTYGFFTPEEMESVKILPGISTHEDDMIKVLRFASQMGYYKPEILFLGIEPAFLGEGMELSPVLDKNFSTYVDVAIDKITE